MFPYPRWNREKRVRGTLPRSRIPLPTFDLYRPLSIFCNLLLRILNVRIGKGRLRGGRGGCTLAKGDECNETRRDESKEKQEEERGGQQLHRDLGTGDSFRITTPWGDAALIFPRIFNRDLLLSPSVRTTVSSFHRFYLSYRAASISRWCFSLSSSSSMAPAGTDTDLDNLYAGGSLKLHGRREKKREERESRGSRALNPISLCREVVGGLLLLHGRRAISHVLFPLR